MACGLYKMRDSSFALEYYVQFDNMSGLEIVGGRILHVSVALFLCRKHQLWERYGASQARENACTLIVERIPKWGSLCVLDR